MPSPEIRFPLYLVFSLGGVAASLLLLGWAQVSRRGDLLAQWWWMPLLLTALATTRLLWGWRQGPVAGEEAELEEVEER